MNILIITSLYPEFEGDSIKRTSFAIHELVKGLETFDVHVKKVIRPTFENQWRKFEFYPKKFRRENIDGILVETKSFYNMSILGTIVTKNDVNYIKEALVDIDLIVSHMPEDTKLARDIYKKFNIPFICVLHESDILGFKRQAKIISAAKNIYARSWSIQRMVQEHGFKVDGVVYSGIEENFIIKEKHFSQKNYIKILTVAGLQKKKNIDIILRALAQLPKEYNWEYTIIGEGDQYNNIKNLIIELKLENKVKMLGMKTRDECILAMRDNDVFVMPSYPETFGLVYLEAMASGCIVICSKGWGIDGLIENGKNGYTVEPYSIEDLKNVFEIIFNNPQDDLINHSLKAIKQYTLVNAQKNYADIIKKNIINEN